MARPRLPDAVKAAKGTLQPCRVNKDQPKLDTCSPGEPPKHLAPDERAVWIEMAAQVEPMRVQTVADSRAFLQMVRALALADRAAADPDATYSERVATSKATLPWLSAFGITPSSRSKVSAAPKVEKEDPLAEFLS